MSGFLTAEEVAQLTGYRRPSLQIQWLKSRRLRFFVNGAGYPVVSWGTVHGDNVTPLPWTPNLSALKERA